MEKFLYLLNDFFGIEHYFVFFENEDVKNTGPWIVADIVFGFTYLKLVDNALKYSKDDVLARYDECRDSNDLEETLLEAAVYPSGETLGFYNTSQYNMEKLCSLENEKECSELLAKYIEGFSDNIRKVFDELYFDEVVLKYLKDTQMTLEVLKLFNNTPLEGGRYSSYSNFMRTFSDFIHCIWTDEIYSMVRDPISNYDVFSSYHYIHEAIEEYGSFLNNLLLTEVDFKNNESVKIYDPDSSGAYILNKTKDSISQISEDTNVELYGKSKKTENKLLYLAKRSVSKRDPYEIEGATILDVSEDIFSLNGIEGYGDFDLIVSNYLYNGLAEHKDILEAFKRKSDKSTKLAIALDSLDDFIDDLDEIIGHDHLEALISFKNHYILICNLDKSESKRGRFLLIDESDAEVEDKQVDRENQEAFSNNRYDFYNAPHWKTLSESDKNKMESVLKSYEAFEDSIDAILIENDEYDRDMIEILL